MSQRNSEAGWKILGESREGKDDSSSGGEGVDALPKLDMGDQLDFDGILDPGMEKRSEGRPVTSIQSITPMMNYQQASGMKAPYEKEAQRVPDLSSSIVDQRDLSNPRP